MSVYDEVSSIINRPQIFENKTFNQIFKQNEYVIPKYIWEQYYSQFPWMFYENGILQCRYCQEAFKRFESHIESDEWTEVNEYSYRFFNKEDLILILKIHDFSENHTRSIEILNSENESLQQNTDVIESDRSGETCNNETNNNINDSLSDEILPLPIICSSKSSSRWSHYMDYYPWLYLKHNNPGCRYCEEAFKISTEMSSTKWTDPTPTFEINCIDRPNRALRRHQLSKNHRRAIDVLNGTPLNSEIDLINEDFPRVFRKERWEFIKRKYQWLDYKMGNYHCVYCEQAYVNPQIINTFETESNKYSETGKLRHFNRHQNSNIHKTAEDRFHSNGSIMSVEMILNDVELVNNLTFNEEETGNYRTVSSPEISNELWRKLLVKYPWFMGENGKYYGCKVCQKTSKLSTNFSNLNLWTQGTIPFTIITTYEHLRKKLYSHNLNKTHLSGVINMDRSPSNLGSFNFDKLPQFDILTNENLELSNQVSFNRFLTANIINTDNNDNVYDLI